MNAVAAIGGPALLQAAKAYRALDPSDIWVLGLTTPRDPKDPLVRSLEALVEPLMQPYFAGVAQAHVAAMSAQLTTLLLPTSADAQRSVTALSAELWKDVAATFALVAMLDAAHLIQPITLVLDDDSTALSRTAVAWARARGVPSATIPAHVPVRRPRTPVADRTIAVGERARNAYRASNFDSTRIVSVAPLPADADAAAEPRSTARAAARAAFTRALNWAETDFVVVVEPATDARVSALEPAGAFARSLADIFRAVVVARASVPDLRLVINGAPSATGFGTAADAAVSAGLTTADFAYSESDHQVWLAGADLAVCVESTRAMEAGSFGIPAINLWRPVNWYRGPSFAAEDGVLDVTPQLLGPTLVALAHNSELRAQIASIAGQRLAADAPVGARSTAAIARALVRQRLPDGALAHHQHNNLFYAPPYWYADAGLPAPPQPKPDILIYAPPYWHGSAGHRALYRLCHLINQAGGNASIYPGTHLHPRWNTPRRDTEITERTVVVYPEIYFPSLPAKRVVRWCLNKPGLLGGPQTYGDEEMVFYYHQAYREAAQAATAEVLGDERQLQIAVTEPELFFNDRSRPRVYDCAFVYKGQKLYDRVQPRQIRDAYVIQSGWPASREETAALLRGCRRLYSFDWSSAIVAEAVICGVEVYMVDQDGSPCYAGTEGWNIENYEQQYYDLAPVRRFLELIAERWGD